MLVGSGQVVTRWEDGSGQLFTRRMASSEGLVTRWEVGG